MSTAGTEPLGQLIKSYKKLEVEDYQRVYVWDTENIENLFSDIKTCIQFPSDRDHFFGTLILQKHPSEKGSVTVVDGQQRLTTCFMIFAALRDAVARLPEREIPGEDDDDLGTDVLKEALSYLIPDKKKTESRFFPNRLLRMMWNKSVLPSSGPAQAPLPWGRASSYERATSLNLDFRRAVKKVRAMVDADLAEKATDQEKLARANLLMETLSSRFTVLKVVTDSIDESLDIFLTLNSRGQELKASDLARGEILKRQTAALAEDAAIRTLHTNNLDDWNHMSLQVIDHEVFLRHFLVANSNHQVSKKMVLEEITSRVATDDRDIKLEARKAAKLWDEIKQSAAIYAEIITPTTGTKLYKLHMGFLEMLMLSHRVLFLNVLPQPLSPSDLEKIAVATSVLSYRWTLAGQNAQELETFFRKTGQWFASNADVNGLCEKLYDQAREVPAVSLKRWSTARDGSAHARALLYYIYWTLAGDGLVWPISQMHLEHIAPQKFTDEWMKIIVEGEEPDEDAYEEIITGAGNLTLLDPTLNIKAKNLSFSAKKNHYSKSEISLVKDLVAYDTWDPTLIKDRTRWLADMFDVLWPIDTTERQVVSFSDWQNGDD